jgi:hypothetical protein
MMFNIEKHKEFEAKGFISTAACLHREALAEVERLRKVYGPVMYDDVKDVLSFDDPA